MRLGRVLAELTPEEPEVHGLVALMEIQASRFKARTAADGTPILLLDQNRARWDHLLIRRGLTALRRAEQLGGAPGPYTLQGAIAACHGQARTADETDWHRIAALYDALAALTPSPIVELNRAVAVAMASGPQAGLDVVDTLLEEPALRTYHLLPSVRGDFLMKLGRLEEARHEFERAASLTRNVRERELMLRRAAECEAEASDAGGAMDPIDTVRAWHEALNAGDVDRLVALSHPDIEVGGPRGSGYGHQRLRDWFGHAGVKLQFNRAYVRDATVVVEQLAAWPDSDPVAVSSVFHVAEHLVTSVARYDDGLEAALGAAGLSTTDAVTT